MLLALLLADSSYARDDGSLYAPPGRRDWSSFVVQVLDDGV